LRAAGLVTERREANRIIYSLASERLALCVGEFLSTVCPDQMLLRRHRTQRVAASGEAEDSGSEGKTLKGKA
jgi:hypothetical protein